MKKSFTHIIHPLKPLIDQDAKILILGSFPSIKSREYNFYYMNKYNRFYDVIGALFNLEIKNKNIEEKIQIFKNLKISLYDVVYECDIDASKDSSIKNVIPTDIEKLTKDTSVKMIFTNGNKAYELFKKYHPSLKAIKLPSTSPANATYSLEKLIKEWSIIKEYL